jgi:hypothetical protein
VNAFFSTLDEMQSLRQLLINFLRLPLAADAIPGNFLEAALAHVRQADRLNTYDYVDVIDRKKCIGWSIKSTKATTPVTWKRAKLPDQTSLIAASRETTEGCQILGDSIIEFCNAHARESLDKFGLEKIYYARLIVHADQRAQYFERELCSRMAPEIFSKSEFRWEWSVQKVTKTKEQLPSLHGTHLPTGKKWWAWHGLGENQLHFSGERAWWPEKAANHAIHFDLPEPREMLSFADLAALLSSLDDCV